MALFQPTNISPDALNGAGNGTIDATQPLTVSWQVNGNSPLVAYQIRIMANNTDSILRLDTGKVTLDEPFFGVTSLGKGKLFSVTIPAAQLASAGITNQSSIGYKLSIKQWWNDTDAIEQTSASYFITRATPDLFMATIGRADRFDYQEYTFECVYSQQQQDAIQWNRWELQANENGKYVTIADTGIVFSPGTSADGNSIYLEYTHNGFAIGVDSNNNNVPIQHRVKCTVQTENGVTVDTGWKEFTTGMNASHIPATLQLCIQKETDSIKIEMPKNFPIQGTANGSYSFVTQQYAQWLSLPANSSVAFGGEGDDSLNIGASSPYMIYCKMSVTSVAEPVTYLVADYGDYQVVFTYDANGFYVEKNGEEIWSTEAAVSAGEFFAIAISDDTVLLGTNISGAVTVNAYAINPWINGATLQALTIGGPGIVRAAHITAELTEQQITSALQSEYSFFTYTNNTQFYGRFNGTLYTGFITNNTDSLSIYRKKTDDVIFQLIANIPISQRFFYDYSALNQVTYEYFFMLMLPDLSVQERHGVATVTPCWWDYDVLCCSQNNVGDYLVENEYRFALNVESGNVGNNNSPTLHKNFTQYPLRQPNASNYRSGTLTALIGKKQDDAYVDSTGLMQELYALSTSPLTKFLKTRKGEILQIETSAPVAMQISDKYAVQPVKISLPWVEVGDASNANILGGSYSGGLPSFSVNPETMMLTMEYDANSDMGADSFSLNGADLYINNPGVYAAEDFSINSDNEVILDTD